MSRTRFDEKVIDYSVFLSGNIFLGTATVQLPSLEMASDPLKGAGIAGEMSSITPGHFGPMTVTLNWRSRPAAESIQLMQPKQHLIEFREAVNSFNKVTNEYEEIGKKIIVRAIPKKFDLGKLETGSTVDSTTELDTNYLKFVDNGRTLIEIDKVNNIYVVDGVDYRAKTRSLLGL